MQGKTPSWLYHRCLGIAQHSRGNTIEAVAALELALEAAVREGATPGEEAKDLVELHLLLREYAYYLGDSMQKSAEHYLEACKSEDLEQARKAQLGHLKARLNLPDNNTNAEKTRNVFKSTLVQENGEKQMAQLLKMLARDIDQCRAVQVLCWAMSARGI